MDQKLAFCTERGVCMIASAKNRMHTLKIGGEEVGIGLKGLAENGAYGPP